MMHLLGGDGKTKVTATAGTRIRIACGGAGGSGFYTHILNLRYTPGATTHTGTLMRGTSRTRATAALAAAGTSLVVAAELTDGAGNAIAASDVVAVKLDNGDWHVSAVTSWDSSTLTMVLTTAIPTGRSVKKGGKVVCYGVQSDTYHASNQVALTTGATRQFPELAGQFVSLCRASAPGEPVIFDSDNATNAGTVDVINWGYAKL